MIVPVVPQDAVTVALGIVELVASKRPDEGDKANAPQKQRNRNQIDERFHDASPYRSRSALSDTVIEDDDIAKAAINGVAKPRSATGTAIML